MKTINELLSENLRRLRLQRNLNQDEMAELVGCSKTHLSQLELGNYWISDDLINKICRTLKIDPDELFKDCDKNPKISDHDIMIGVVDALKNKATPQAIKLSSLYDKLSETSQKSVMLMLEGTKSRTNVKRIRRSK